MNSKEYIYETSQKTEQDEWMKGFIIRNLPIFGPNWSRHIAVASQRRNLERTLYLDRIYQKIRQVPGVILEFGVQWGSTIAQLIALRGIYEPYNVRRRVIGFDTFKGLAGTQTEFDGDSFQDGDYSVAPQYLAELEELLRIGEAQSPYPDIKKFELVAGEATYEFAAWLDRNPGATVALAILDMDIYLPTKGVLELLVPRLARGSVLVFDEFNHPAFPGEARAVMEVLDINKHRLVLDPLEGNAAHIVWEL